MILTDVQIKFLNCETSLCGCSKLTHHIVNSNSFGKNVEGTSYTYVHVHVESRSKISTTFEGRNSEYYLKLLISNIILV